MIAQKLAERMGRKDLTSRERDVLKQIVCGKSNKEIGIELNNYQTTVKSHINSLLNKLCVADRTQAAPVALQRGIMSIESVPLEY